MNEITRNTTAKMEVETTRKSNPIVQDTKKDKEGNRILRHYGMIPMFNYGCIPQTWEDPNHEDKATGCFGDNDPLDLVDLTPKDVLLMSIGNLKLIGAFCLIDQGELDWKIVALNEEYAKEHGIRDAETYA